MLPRCLRLAAAGTVGHNVASSSRVLYRAISSTNKAPADSIFTEPQPWDHVFEGVESPKAAPRPRATIARSRRQAMGQREIHAFDEMFNTIFTAAAEQDASLPASTVGKPGGDLIQLFTKIQKHSKRRLTNTEKDEALDIKKEAMEKCTSDQALLEWAMKEVFGESEQFRAAAAKAVEDAQKAIEALPPGSREPSFSLPDLQPQTYPQLIALLMKTFRDHYRDPHLALSIFDHARTLSAESYVFGCSTLAYNELIETRWMCFRDLESVRDALTEMRMNGIDCNRRTREIVDIIRHNVALQGAGGRDAQTTLTLIADIEELCAIQQPTDSRYLSKSAAMEAAKRKNKWSEEWKESTFTQKDDGWQFGAWDEDPLRRYPKAKKDTRPPPLIRYAPSPADLAEQAREQAALLAESSAIHEPRQDPPTGFLDGDDDGAGLDDEDDLYWDPLPDVEAVAEEKSA